MGPGRGAALLFELDFWREHYALHSIGTEISGWLLRSHDACKREPDGRLPIVAVNAVPSNEFDLWRRRMGFIWALARVQESETDADSGERGKVNSRRGCERQRRQAVWAGAARELGSICLQHRVVVGGAGLFLVPALLPVLKARLLPIGFRDAHCVPHAVLIRLSNTGAARCTLARSAYSPQRRAAACMVRTGGVCSPLVCCGARPSSCRRGPVMCARCSVS